MSLPREKLVNVVVFMERAPHGQGGEARAWAQTLEAVHAEIEAIDAAALAAAQKSAEEPTK